MDSYEAIDLALDQLNREYREFISRHRFNESVPDGTFNIEVDWYIKRMTDLRIMRDETLRRRTTWFLDRFEKNKDDKKIMMEVEAY